MPTRVLRVSEVKMRITSARESCPRRPPCECFPAESGSRWLRVVRQIQRVRLQPDDHVPRRGIAEVVPALGSAPENQTWEEIVGVLGHPTQASPWELREATRTLTVNDAPSIDPAPPQNAGDDDVCTFLCEWTDKHGRCNVPVFGDRVWMSHHLSRYHNVTGHEKSQRACLWQGCTETMNKGSLARHVVSRHLRAGASCGFCSKVYSRADVARRHTKKCKVANGVAGRGEQSRW